MKPKQRIIAAAFLTRSTKHWRSCSVRLGQKLHKALPSQNNMYSSNAIIMNSVYYLFSGYLSFTLSLVLLQFTLIFPQVY